MNKEEEIIFDDQYKISIPQLVFNTYVDSKLKLQTLLNNNGYYGRAIVYNKREFGSPTDFLYVKIYLINSNWKYKWPLNTYFNMNTGKIVPVKSKIKPTPQLREGMKTLVGAMQQWKKHNLNPVGLTLSSILSSYSNMGAANRETVVTQLMHYGLTRDEKFLLSDQDDVEELYYNLFDQKYYV